MALQPLSEGLSVQICFWMSPAAIALNSRLLLDRKVGLAPKPVLLEYSNDLANRSLPSSPSKHFLIVSVSMPVSPPVQACQLLSLIDLLRHHT